MGYLNSYYGASLIHVWTLKYDTNIELDMLVLYILTHYNHLHTWVYIEYEFLNSVARPFWILVRIFELDRLQKEELAHDCLNFSSQHES